MKLDKKVLERITCFFRVNIKNVALRLATQRSIREKEKIASSFDKQWNHLLQETRKSCLKELINRIEKEIENRQPDMPGELVACIIKINDACLQKNNLGLLIQTHDFLFEKNQSNTLRHRQIIEGLRL